MDKVIILRYSEIHLKGGNRGYFERVFAINIEKSLKGLRHELKRSGGRYFVQNFDDSDCEEILSRLKKVFGIYSMSVAERVPSDIEEIFNCARQICPENCTFKVETHRADKKFYLNSMQLSAEIGGRLIEAKENLQVDIHNPQFTVHIDVREEGYSLVFGEFIKGAGGIPVGTSGKGLLLISGGIDSPVAGHMMAKRGLSLNFLHFHSYPYTNLQARDKVVELAKILSSYTLGGKMFIVSVTEIQEEIHKKCSGEFMVTLLRRFMMRIAEKIAKDTGAQCIVTGESLGQVASQTVEGMTSSNAVIKDLPVLRPLCGFDKDEIIERSRQIGTYDVSIQPFEDCCTVFLPKHPVIKPTIEQVLKEEEKLDVDALFERAVKTVEVIEIH